MLASSSVFSGSARRHAAAVAWSGHPAALANARLAVCAVARVCEAQLPLCMITPRNSPRAGGEVSSAHIDQPPADSPSIVTVDGLPPKAAMFRCTQRSADSWSSRP